MALFILIDPEGRQHQTHCDVSGKPHCPEGWEAHRVRRHTLDPEFERYDPKARRWIKDREGRARKDEEMRVLSLTAPQVYAELMSRIVALEAILAKLEAA